MLRRRATIGLALAGTAALAVWTMAAAPAAADDARLTVTPAVYRADDASQSANIQLVRHGWGGHHGGWGGGYRGGWGGGYRGGYRGYGFGGYYRPYYRPYIGIGIGPGYGYGGYGGYPAYGYGYGGGYGCW